MREFSDSENLLIKKLVEIQQEGAAGSLAELQVARLLRNELKFFALKWSTEPKDEVILYVRNEDKENLKKIDNLYFKIADFIYFIEELENIGFVKLQNIPSNNDKNFTILYDRDKYKYDPKDDNFWVEIKDVKIGNRNISGEALVALKEWHKFNTDFAKDLEKCALSIIYPMPLARSYVENDFMTYEQKALKKQLKDTKSSLRWARWTFWVTLIGVIVALWGLNRDESHKSNDNSNLSNTSLHEVVANEPQRTDTIRVLNKTQ